jgi:hypothetical protein
MEPEKKKVVCKKCGGENFWLNEGYVWKCWVDDEGNLNCQSPTSEIEKIECKDCGEEVGENQFVSINFD